MLVFPYTIEKYLEYRPFSSYGHIHMRFRRQHGQCNSPLHFLNKPDTIHIPVFFAKRIFLSRCALCSGFDIVVRLHRARSTESNYNDFFFRWIFRASLCKNSSRIALTKIFKIKEDIFVYSILINANVYKWMVRTLQHKKFSIFGNPFQISQYLKINF